MTTEVINSNRTVAAMIHLSTFSQLIFPFGNFLFPLLLWSLKKEDPFVNEHGKQALNFQISLYLYLFFLTGIGFAGAFILGVHQTFHENVQWSESLGLLDRPADFLPVIYFLALIAFFMLSLFLLSIYTVISATIKAGEGEPYKYPFSINFLNANKVSANSGN
jgi:uncharacterized protein